MRKILFVVLIGVALIFTGCGTNPSLEQKEEASKLCKIEVLSSQDDTLLTTIDEQEIVETLMHSDKWEVIEELPEELIPEYKLIVYQEKTLLQGQDPDKEREYEIIERITTYQNTSYVEESISSEVIKNMKVPDIFLTQYYIVPDEMSSDLQSTLQ